MPYFYLIIFVLSLWWAIPLKAQSYLVDAEHITIENGLANLLTHAVYQDSRGLVWISTKYGLNRYDGYSFKLYTQQGYDLNEDAKIVKIIEDERQNLWLFYGYGGGEFANEILVSIEILDPIQEKVIPIETYLNAPLPFQFSNTKLMYVNDPQNRIWVSTVNQEGETHPNELFLYEGGRFKKIFEHTKNSFSFLTIDKKANLWLGGEKEILCIDSTSKILDQVELPYPVNGIWEGENEMYFAGIKEENSYKEVVAWKRKWGHSNLEPFDFFDKNGKVNLRASHRPPIYKNKQGNWYVHLNQALHIFDKEGKKIVTINDLLKGNKGINYTGNFEGENFMWVSSPVGLIKIRVKKNPFQLVHKYEDKYSDCRGIAEDDDGNIYFINNFIYQWNPSNQQIQQVSSNNAAYGLISYNNLIWASDYTKTTLGYHVDLTTQNEILYPSLKAALAFNFLPTQRPNIYLAGTDKGLEYIDVEAQKILPFEASSPGDSIYQLLQKCSVFDLHQNAAGIWAATNKGIFLIDENQRSLQHFDTPKHLPFQHIRHIHEDKDGVFWLATEGGGILKWQPVLDKKETSQYRQWTTKDGLANDYTYAIYEDDYDRLWIPSDGGLMCMDKKTEQLLKTYTEEDGLLHDEFNLTSHYQAKDGTLYLGGIGGLIRFHPSTFIAENAKQSALEFTAYSVLEGDSEKMIDRTDILSYTDKITIHPSDKLLELRFALLDFDKPELHRYAYQIEGYTNQWQIIEENYLRITNLPYGTYQLKIKGQNINKGWSEKELSLKIHVLKPFYLQWWFLMLLLLAGVVGIWLTIKKRELNLKADRERLEVEVKKRTLTIQQQAEALKELDKAKTRFFSNITHEFRTPLTLIIGPLEQILGEDASLPLRNRLFSIFKNARHLLTLINQMLDLSKLEGGKMRVEVSRGDLVAYTQEITYRLEPLARKKNQALILSTELSTWETHFDKQKWGKIIYNLLSNAIKFTPDGGTVEVELKPFKKKNKKYIFLLVKDNGIGMEREALNQVFNRFYQVDGSYTRTQEGTGIGLALVKELVELQGGTIDVRSQVGIGTTFEIKLPIPKDFTRSDEVIPLPLENTTVIPETLEEDFIPIPANARVLEKRLPRSKKEKLELLLVEDNEDMRNYIRHCIDSSDYHISEAKDGEEGLKKALATVPDLVVLDVMMPKKNGFEVTKAIRDHLVTSHIPIVLLTAKTSLESRLEGFRRGADAYLTKPFSPAELVLRIQKLIEIRQLLQARYQSQSQANLADNPFEKEDKFIEEVRDFIRKNLENPELTGDSISKHFAMSRTALYRKLKALTNQSISQLIRTIRLETAYQLIEEGQLSLSEITYQTGFSSPSHFSRAFKSAYGKSPSDVKKSVIS